MRPGPSPFVLLRANRTLLSSRLLARTPCRGLTSGPVPEPTFYEKLKPALPFIFWWTVITSLATHQLRMRHATEAESGVAHAKVSVLEGLVSRLRKGEIIDDNDIEKELEMVGLRERTKLSLKEEEALTYVKDVGWGQALFGRKFGRKTAEQEEKEAVEEWAKVVTEASLPAQQSVPPPTESPHVTPQRTTAVRRAPSATVYM